MTDRSPALFGHRDESDSPGANPGELGTVQPDFVRPDAGGPDFVEPDLDQSGPDWPPLVGGAAGLRQLEAALSAPVHAYLLVGTVAGDKRAVARTFAGELLAATSAAAGSDVVARHRRRARQATHPDVLFVEPEGRALLAAEASTLIAEAGRRSLEGAGKVIICDRFHTASPGVAASLLKTIEEPPPATTIVLLADEVPPGHATVASRCVIIRFPAPVPDEVCEWLIRSGVSPTVAQRAARAVGVDPGQAGQLVAGGNLAERVEAWWSIPEQLDGTGARAAALVDDLRAQIDASVAATSTSAATADSTTAAGTGASGPETSGDGGGYVAGAGGRSESQKQDRRKRLARDTELRFGFALLAERYRELLDTSAFGQVEGALELLREAKAALVRNPDEKLLLQNLLLHLPRG